MPGAGPPRRRLAGPAPGHSQALSSHTLVIANVLVHGGHYYFCGFGRGVLNAIMASARAHRCNRAGTSAFYERLAPPTFSDAISSAEEAFTLI